MILAVDIGNTNIVVGCIKGEEIRFVRGRLKFGNSKNAAPFPSMVVIYNQKGI